MVLGEGGWRPSTPRRAHALREVLFSRRLAGQKGRHQPSESTNSKRCVTASALPDFCTCACLRSADAY